jgi:hypothetical protein
MYHRLSTLSLRVVALVAYMLLVVLVVSGQGLHLL